MMGNVSTRLQPSRLLKQSRLRKVVRKAPPTPITVAADESLQTKDNSLLGRLKDVYVHSVTKTMQKAPSPVNLGGDLESRHSHKLPHSTNSLSLDTELDPTEVPLGRLSTRRAVELLMLHQGEEETAAVEMIAQKFKLDTEDTKSIVKYFAVFKLAQVEELGKPDMKISLTD